MSFFKNNFTMVVFNAAVWIGGTASFIPVFKIVISYPGLIGTFTGVLPFMTLVSTSVIIIRSTFFCLSNPDQSCTSHKGQENVKSLHSDDFLSRIEWSKPQMLSSGKKYYI